MTTNFDAYSPREIASRVRDAGVVKARSNALRVLALAGAFIPLGALFFTVVTTGASIGFGVNRLLGGLAFSTGLVMVLIGGGELFTGNNLVAMAWASRLITKRELLRNWALAYTGNVIGALGTVTVVWAAGVDRFSGGAVGQTAIAVGAAKSDLSMGRAVAPGIMCNVLVCMAVWLAMGGRTVVDRFVAVILPIASFVTIGFEHSTANWFFLPYAVALDGFEDGGFITGSLVNLAAVTVGNVIGGTLLVAGVYWLAYLRKGAQTPHAA